jgi:hypothetical protein
MPRRTTIRCSPLFASLTLVFACAGDRESHSTTAPPVEQASAPSQLETVETSTRRRPAVELSRRLHEAAMTEVVLDPRGRAALTLDTEGNVRLWADVLTERVATPFALPVYEPVWMSLARTTGGGLVAGFIDTAGGARVAKIELSEGEARWIPAFEIPPTDPLFELHVLDGGERILALSVDHRLHLFDTDGRTLSKIDEVGFVPWQLRVAQPPGENPSVLAILAEPSRIEPISLLEDQLARSAEAFEVELDRGPNRNDLALNSDGRSALILRHPKARGKRFELEIVDLPSGDRRLLAGESDLSLRPRLHPFDGRKILLESGSGHGFWVELDQAVAWPQSEEERAGLEATGVTPVALHGSDPRSMLHTVVAAERRFVPTPDGLTVSSIAGDGHRLLGRRPFAPSAVALDEHGRRVAWGTQEGILLETLEATAELRRLDPGESAMEPLAFLGDDTLLATGPGGVAAILDLAEGHVLETRTIAFDWGIANVGWRHASADALGALVLSSTKPAAPVRVVHASGKAFGEALEVPRDDRWMWPEGGKPRGMKKEDWLARIGLAAPKALRPAEVVRTEPDPTGRILAIVQKTAHHAGFDADEQRWIEGPHDYVVTVFERASSRRLWTHAAAGFTGLAWSGDGRRIAVAGTGAGHVLAAETGETLHERRDLGLTEAAPRG